MVATECKNIGASLPQIQTTTQRRVAGIILAILSTLFLLATGTAQRAQAQTESILYSFKGVDSTTNTYDGSSPQASLISDAAGNLYGTTYSGGSNGTGTVFELVKSSAGYSENVLYSFKSYGNNDGLAPLAGLVFDGAGNLYGTTAGGGAYGDGTVFELVKSSSGYSETVLYNFSAVDNLGTNTGGAGPSACPIMDSKSGNLYGTTSYGGSSGNGTVFALVKSSSGYSEIVLHNFSAADNQGTNADGERPSAGLIMDSPGNLYGTTLGGGSASGGTVFELVKSSGYSETVLHNFQYNTTSDGSSPAGTLISDSHGNLYGTTVFGGQYDGGIVFELVKGGGGTYTETILHNLGQGDDGNGTYAGLISDAAGNLYGTTENGGSSANCDFQYGCGVIFELVKSSGYSENVLYNFGSSSDDGLYSNASLISDSSGNLYGTTLSGGSSSNCFDGCGTVFEFTTSQLGAIQAIISQVNSLYSDGVLNSGQDSSLVKELDDAINAINAGKTNKAIGNLESFITEVNDLYNSGVLDQSDYTQLYDAANAVIAQLQAS